MEWHKKNSNLEDVSNLPVKTLSAKTDEISSAEIFSDKIFLPKNIY